MHQHHGHHDENRNAKFSVNGSRRTANGEQDQCRLSCDGVVVVAEGQPHVQSNQSEHQGAQDLAFRKVEAVQPSPALSKLCSGCWCWTKSSPSCWEARFPFLSPRIRSLRPSQPGVCRCLRWNWPWWAWSCCLIGWKVNQHHTAHGDHDGKFNTGHIG